MKKIIALVVFAGMLFSCAEDMDDNLTAGTSASVQFNFTHNWDGTDVNSETFNTIQHTNDNGEELSIEKLRYLVSNITFQAEDGTTYTVEGYNLVDVTNNANLSYAPTQTIPFGNYTNVSFTFGFNNDDNYSQTYPDLNSASWNVPEMMGGGYHYMQLEGKFINTNSEEVGYAYHTIRAVNMSNAPDLTFQDTFFQVDLGAVTINSNTTFNIEMNIAEWFKSPNQWDLNVLNNTLMPNYDAQIMMYENGQNVFSLGSIQ